MKKIPRILLFAVLLLALLAATGVVLTRTRRMSLFLEARDRITRGEDEDEVLRDLGRGIDWDPEDPGAARRIVAEALGKEPAVGIALTVHRAGAWALLRSPAGQRLFERTDGGWREVR